MGYFDREAEGSFREIDGVTVYFPFGMIGKGRVIPSEDIKMKLLNFHGRMEKFSFFVMFPYVLIIGVARQINLIGLSPVFLFGILWLAAQLYHTRKLPVHDAIPTSSDAAQSFLRAIPGRIRWTLGILLLITLLVVIGSLF